MPHPTPQSPRCGPLLSAPSNIWGIRMRSEKSIFVYLPPTAGKKNVGISADVLCADNNDRMVDKGLPYFRPIRIIPNIPPPIISAPIAPVNLGTSIGHTLSFKTLNCW